MNAPLFIGNEVSAAGFRIAGLRTRSPAQNEISTTVSWALDNASLVMISAPYAAFIPQRELESFLCNVTPPVVVIPDIRGTITPIDLSTRLRAQLGVLE